MPQAVTHHLPLLMLSFITHSLLTESKLFIEKLYQFCISDEVIHTIHKEITLQDSFIPHLSIPENIDVLLKLAIKKELCKAVDDTIKNYLSAQIEANTIEFYRNDEYNHHIKVDNTVISEVLNTKAITELIKTFELTQQRLQRLKNYSEIETFIESEEYKQYVTDIELIIHSVIVFKQ